MVISFIMQYIVLQFLYYCLYLGESSILAFIEHKKYQNYGYIFYHELVQDEKMLNIYIEYRSGNDFSCNNIKSQMWILW